MNEDNNDNKVDSFDETDSKAYPDSHIDSKNEAPKKLNTENVGTFEGIVKQRTSFDTVNDDIDSDIDSNTDINSSSDNRIDSNNNNSSASIEAEVEPVYETPKIETNNV